MTHLLKQETSTLNSPGKYLYKQFTYSTNSVAVKEHMPTVALR